VGVRMLAVRWGAGFSKTLNSIRMKTFEERALLVNRDGRVGRSGTTEKPGGVEIIEQHQDEDVQRTGFIRSSRCPSEHHEQRVTSTFSRAQSFVGHNPAAVAAVGEPTANRGSIFSSSNVKSVADGVLLSVPVHPFGKNRNNGKKINLRGLYLLTRLKLYPILTPALKVG
jgi:hypothetical protein